MDRNLLELYEDGGRKLTKAVEHLDRNDLTAFPVPNTWSIQQLVVHLADCDLVFSDRIKRVVAEDKPQLLAFDESRWAKNLHYELQSPQDAVELFALNRRVTAAVLKVLPDEAFARTGVHSEKGELKLEQIVRTAVNHLDHHLKFLYDKREKLGKMMW
ncbi:MAG: hypothetical protein AVDCRST_MAG64-2491 [uncultured Phycisphaerae bacterium]|uniref:DinB-like domain-containing protein n=1 Tax=uncultured Phycisphaerae bacterium TaxID=904963 RepID=A0A6J4PGM7_9BACT|nr:MAG: hypothetical protein AVDCRST_MAG64-2491 [uncultured Phycisphaerae bacterium]